jgi:competence protein ComEA
MTPMEGKGLLRGAGLLLVLALLRFGLTHFGKGDPLSSMGTDELPSMIREAREAGERTASSARKLDPGERVDPNRAGVDELSRLPGVGRAVAERIVAAREGQGAFRQGADLLEVSGIGPATLSRIEPFLDFSRGPPMELRARRAAPTLVDLNRAGSAELQTLPGIGPALAERIIESRSRDGPFHTPEELTRVRGIGPATLERLRSLIHAGR